VNTYRLHIKSDERGPWSCVIKAKTIDDAIVYGEQVFRDAVVTVSRITDIPQEKLASNKKCQRCGDMIDSWGASVESDICTVCWAKGSPTPGFSRRELATLHGALLVWAAWLDLHESERPDPLHMNIHAIRIRLAGPANDLERLTIPEVRDLGERIWDTLTMEATDMDGPF
jgi:hypothetical protein